nr:MAG TPA: hypothetical protein [Bacteriophage sp.]
MERNPFCGDFKMTKIKPRDSLRCFLTAFTGFT